MGRPRETQRPADERVSVPELAEVGKPKQPSLCPFYFNFLIQELFLTMAMNKYPCFYDDFEKHEIKFSFILGL